ncbi:hypothetical protein pb186bvf_014132 [Paramecium bursaria]
MKKVFVIMMEKHPNIQILVQPSSKRIFTDDEYREVGCLAFGETIRDIVPEIALSDSKKPLAESGLPKYLQDATITLHGQLTDKFKYITHLRNMNEKLKENQNFQPKKALKKVPSYFAIKLEGHLFDTGLLIKSLINYKGIQLSMSQISKLGRMSSMKVMLSFNCFRKKIDYFHIYLLNNGICKFFVEKFIENQQIKFMQQQGFDENYGIYEKHIRMEQIYIKSCIQEKLDNKSVEHKIQILEKKFKESKIQDYSNFLEYVSYKENNFVFRTEFDEIQKSILIEFHKFCRQIQQAIKDFHYKMIVQQLQQIDLNKKAFLANLLIKLLEDNWIKKQIPELQNEIINQGRSKNAVNIIQKQKQQQQQLDIKKDKSSKSFKILILGAVGTGKTTLANKLFNFLSSKDQNQNINSRIDMETKFINVQSVRNNNISIDILDSPSFGGADTNLQDVIQNICKVAKTINMIIYCFNATILRYNRQDLLTISVIQGLYSESWDSLYVTFNFMDLQQQNGEQEAKFQVIDSINKRIKSNIPHQNILYNDDNIGLKILLLIEQQYKEHQYKQGFKKMTIPNMRLIEERCKQYSF